MNFKTFINEAAALVDSAVTKVLAKNVKKTTKGSGPVSVGINKKTVSVSLTKKDGKWNPKVFPNEADEYNYFQGSLQSNGKWKVIDSRGVAKQSAKTISDADAAKAVQSIFDLV